MCLRQTVEELQVQLLIEIVWLSSSWVGNDAIRSRWPFLNHRREYARNRGEPPAYRPPLNKALNFLPLRRKQPGISASLQPQPPYPAYALLYLGPSYLEMSASSRPPNIKMDLAPNHPHQPEEPISPFPADVDVPPLDPSLKLPPKEGEYSDLLLGCATFGYGVYESKEHVRTNEPLKIVKTALDAGINGFDTCE